MCLQTQPDTSVAVKEGEVESTVNTDGTDPDVSNN